MKKSLVIAAVISVGTKLSARSILIDFNIGVILLEPNFAALDVKVKNAMMNPTFAILARAK